MCVCMFMYTYENCIWKKKHWNKINEKNSGNENLQHIIFINMCVCASNSTYYIKVCIKQHVMCVCDTVHV